MHEDPALDRSPPEGPAGGRLWELAAVFGLLGVIGFGGPAAHVALMRREVVERRRWISEQRFVDLLGITNLLPGPNSTELAMLIGLDRAGRTGLVVAGLAFILPAALIVGALAAAYVATGSSPLATSLLYGVAPLTAALLDGVNAAAIGLMVAVSLELGRVAIVDPLSAGLALAALVLLLLRVPSFWIVAGGAAVGVASGFFP